ncbi:MAG: hypothetical protein QOJ02_1483 [Acidobacteriota bacterium]|jgi:hypothetical protein|nr:hypothetical protein [Acidobacteriota bacterium]
MKWKWKPNWKEMRRWKKVALILLAVFLLFQIPFIYRRIRLGNLYSAIRRVNAERVVDQTASAYTDYKGVIHVHSSLGGHSYGNLADIITAANRNNLNFVVMTEHTSPLMDTSAMTLSGVHAGVLFINGNEINTASHDRLLLMPGSAEAAAANTIGTEEVLTHQKAQGGLSFIAYPQEFQSWDVNDYVGMEVYNLYTNTKKINYFVTFFDGLWSYWSYPDLMFARFYERPNDDLKRWDELIAKKNQRVVAIAGADAHANVGFRIGDLTGKELIGLHLDPYERTFHIVRNHVLIEKEQPLTSETLLGALASGHSYIAFDLFGDSSGFTFTADNSQGRKIMGDEIELLDGVRLTVTTPVWSHILLIKDGQVVRDEDGASRKEFPVTERGVYRVEVYLTQLGSLVKDKPWIISNPIYVK